MRSGWRRFCRRRCRRRRRYVTALKRRFRRKGCDGDDDDDADDDDDEEERILQRLSVSTDFKKKLVFSELILNHEHLTPLPGTKVQLERTQAQSKRPKPTTLTVT